MIIRRHIQETPTMDAPRVLARSFRRLRRRDRGSMGVMMAAVIIPVLVGMGTLTIGEGYYGYRRLLLQQTTQSAALAAGNALPTYYSTGSSSAVITAAQTFAKANMPVAAYGTVVPAANVVLGNLSGTTFTSLTASGGTAPDAVQVTGINTIANGNAVALFLGNWFGKPTVDITTKATASYGTGQPFNTIVVNDMSQSFSSELSNQQAADQAILNCVKGATGSTSQFGITLTNGHSTLYQSLSVAGANYSALQTKINNLSGGSCGSNCSTGSNLAAGMYSAIQQFSSGFSGTKKNIVIITDGVPNANNSVNYQAADGIYPTTTSASPTCIGVNTCTDDNLLTMARNQAAIAAASGISVSTIYYSGSTNINDQAGYATSLASLVTGSGVAMVAPTAAKISATIAGFCATMPSALKVVM